MAAISQTPFSNVWISLKISLKLVPKVPIDNSPALFLDNGLARPGDKPLSEPMMVIGIDTNIEVIVVSLTTWEAH